MAKFGLFSRLWLVLVVLFLSAFMVTGYVLLRDARQGFEQHRLLQAKALARTLAEGSLDALVTKDYELLERWVRAARPSPNGAYAALSRPDGQVLNHTDLSLVGTFMAPLDSTDHDIITRKLYHNRPVIEVIHPAVLGNHHLADARVAYYLAGERFFEKDTARRIALILLASLLFLTAGTFLIIRRFTRPVKTLTASIATASLEQPPVLQQNLLARADEIGALSRAFSAMSARLLHSYEAIRRDEEALFAEKERLTVTLRSIGEAVIATDTRGSIILVNNAAERLTGWPQQEACGKPLQEVLAVTDGEQSARVINLLDLCLKNRDADSYSNTAVLRARDGSERLIRYNSSLIRDRDANTIGLILVVQDITEQRKITEELFKASKLESVGILAGGIAHDFNNLLTGILGNIALVKYTTDPGAEIYPMLADAEKGALRARDLTQQLLTFSTGGAPIKKPTSIAQLIRESAAFVLRGSNIKSEFAIPADLWAADIDEGQISQVIHNLVINAAQAMKNGGTITISAENIVMGSGDGDIYHLAPGNYIRISIADQGAGIPKSNLARIFDPFFTTKPKGSGLGLATSYSIVKKHDGHISVESKEQAGTVFHIYLPAGTAALPQGTEDAAGQDAPCRGKGRILIMDDEELVRKVAGTMLKKIGYEVEFARDGSEAVSIYRKALDDGQRFDAVIMDLTIPGGMGGEACMQELRALDPDVRAIVSSGYSNNEVMANYKHYGFRAVVAKPYELAKLRKAVCTVLEGGQ